MDGFATAEEAAAHWKARAEQLETELRETKQSFDEFQQDSRELERELERDLNVAESKIRDLAAENAKATRELRALQEKHGTLREQWAQQARTLEDGMAALRAREEEMRARVRVLEQSNDDIEREERAMQSTLAELEGKYNKAIERNVLLEQELEEKQEMRDGLQRLKDELRDTLNELDVHRRAGNEGRVAMDGVSPQSSPGHATPAQGKLEPVRDLTTVGGSPAIMVQEMIQRIKNMENRLASCRSVVAPLIAPPGMH